jgi:glycerophosphoryl diester phosphodiesterase
MVWSNFSKKHKLMVIGHRGASSVAPANTFLAFDKAIESGADMVEFDVHKTKDGHIVIIHDRTTKRTSSVNINVRKSSLQQVQQVELARGQTIPTLDEVFKQYKGKLHFQVEIKQAGISSYVLKLIEKHSVQKSCIVSSFYHSELRYIKKVNQDIILASLEPTIIHYPFRYLMRNWFVYTTEKHGYHGLHPNFRLVTPQLVSLAHQKNLFINTWTIDDAPTWSYLMNCGVDGIMTNKPRDLVEFLESYQ